MPARTPPLLVLLCAVACVTADGVVREDGAGRLTLRYVPGRHATVRSETDRLGATSVRVESVRPDGRWTVAELAFDDVTRLGEAPAFAGAVVTRTRAGAQEELRLTIPPPDARHRDYLAWVRSKQPDATQAELSLTLPGTARAVDPRGALAGATVRWRVGLDDWARGSGVVLWVRYDRAG